MSVLLRTCSVCGGSGELHALARSGDPQTREDFRCWKCGGDGAYALCRRCGGRGSVPAGEDTCNRCFGDGREPC